MGFPKQPLRIGILGAGTIAVDHAAAAHALGHRITVGCSTSQSSPRWRSFAAAAAEARFERDGEVLLSGGEVAAVVACLPWNITESWLPRLLASPKPVLIEKPIALSSKTLIRVLDQVGHRLEKKWVAFNRRFYPPVLKLRERIATGGLKYAEIHISEPVKRHIDRHGTEILPHVLVYSSSHILDAALFLMGTLRLVHIYGYAEESYPAKFRSLSGLLETAEGVPVALAIHADAPVPVGLRFYFDDKTVWHLSPMERLVAYRDYEVIEPTDEIRIRRYIPKPFLDVVVETSIKPGFLEQMKAFTSGEGREIAATLTESVRLLRLIEAIQESAV